MDFDGVDAIVQVGYVKPDSYMQRVGRTGRGTSAAGKAILLVTENECKATVDAIKTDRGVTLQVQRVTAEAWDRPCGYKSAGRAYTGFLGGYNSNLRALKWTREQLVAEANEIFRGVMCQPPAVDPKLAKKLNLVGLLQTRN